MKASRTRQTLLQVLLLTLAGLTLFPFTIMLLSAAKDPAQIYARFWDWPRPFRWDNFSFGFAVTGRYILNSALVSGVVCALTLLFGTLAAYSFSVLQFRGRMALYTAIIALMMVPGILTLVPLFLVVRDLGLLNSYAGLILPQVAGSLAIAVFLFKNFFDDLPRDLFDTARIDGAREWQILRHVVVPLSVPIVSTVAVINVLGTWNNYVWPLLIVRDEALRTIPLGLAFMETEHYLLLEPGKSMATYVTASIPMVILFLFAMRTFIAGMTGGAIKG